MDNSKLFLIKRIVAHETNGYKSLGELNGKHVDDLSGVMNDFLNEALKEVVESLNKGEAINVNGFVIQLNKKKVRQRRL